MALGPIRFTLTQAITEQRLRACLGDHATLRAEPSRRFQLTYLDSFDWRLFERGSVMESEVLHDGCRLQWRSRENGVCYGRLADIPQPRFAWDLPKSPLRNRLEGILEMRALLPMARVRRTVRSFRVLDKYEKTVLRIEFREDSHADGASKKPQRLARQLCLFPVKGYEGRSQKIASVIEEELGLPRSGDDAYSTAMTVEGRTPGTYSSRLQFDLEPKLPAATALRRILLHLLDTMEINEAGVIEDIDTEFLHDFRVAVRRTRAALTQFRDVLLQVEVARYVRDFAWLGQITGRPRDLDVYLLSFDDYKESLDPDHADDLEPLREFLKRQKSAAYGELAGHLRSSRYRRLKRDWRAFLSVEDTGIAHRQKGDGPILELANLRIWRVYRRVLAEGAAIDDSSPAEALHDLRKTCKKLRYLMEFFQDLYSAERIRPAIKALKSLQDNLGAFQDLEVQRDALMSFSRAMMAERRAPAETFVAMGILIDGLQRGQRQARVEFHSRFADFSAKHNRKSCKALFAPRQRSGGIAHEDSRVL